MKILRHPLFMKPTPESELEQVIDRELRALTPPRAPATLLPRVLQAIAERERRPWWQKSFAHWPWPARLTFFVATTAIATLLLYFTSGIASGVSLGGLSEEVSVLAGHWQDVRDLLGALGSAGLALVRAAGPGLLWGVAGLAAVSYFTTFALGTLCYRVASQRI